MSGWFQKEKFQRAPSVDLESGGGGGSSEHAVQGGGGSPGRIAWAEEGAPERHFDNAPGMAGYAALHRSLLYTTNWQPVL